MSSFTLDGIDKLAKHLQTILTDPSGVTVVARFVCLSDELVILNYNL